MTSQVLFVQGSGGVPDYSAVEQRAFTSALFGGHYFENLSADIGAIGRGHGALTANAMRVTANPSPNNTVLIAPGIVGVRGTQDPEQGLYLCPLDSTETLPVSDKPAGGSTRNDLVVAQVKDNAYNDFSEDEWEPVIVEGTPATTGSQSDPTVPEDCLVLARITVTGGGGGTVITNGDITDLRPQARSTGGITPVMLRDSFPNPQDFDVIWESSTEQLLMYSDEDWMVIGKNLDSTWVGYGTNATRWNNVTMGSGGSSYSRYTRFGRTIIGIAGFELGTGASSTGVISLNLPTPALADNGLRYMGGGRMWTGSAFFSCTAEINPDDNPGILTNFATAGTQAWGTTIPVTWGNGMHMRTFFKYQADTV